MIPIRLTIQGLYSYQKKQTIEFAPLMEGQIFGIFGAVGSGKSSILDAITYALYGETERLNLRDNRNYNMMNLQSKEMEIDFEFENFDGKQYRFLVQVKRYSSNFDRVYSPKRRAFIREGDRWKPIETESAETIIGLSYENFKRSIIIPQGKFQEFLQLGSADRTRMLKEIFQLEKYELSAKVKKLQSANELEKTEFSTRLEQHAGISETGLAERQKLLESRQEEYERKEKDLKGLDGQLVIQEKARQANIDLQQKKEKEQEILKRAAHFEALRSKLRSFDLADRGFRGLIEKSGELTDRLNEANAVKEQESETLAGTEQRIRELETQKAELQQHLDQKDTRVKEARDLELWSKILASESERGGLRKRIANSDVEISRAKAHVQALEEKENDIAGQITQLRDSIPPPSLLAELQGWFNKVDSLQEMLDETLDRTRSKRARIEEVRSGISAILAQTGHQDQYEISRKAGQATENILDSWETQLTNRQESIQEEISVVRLHARLGEWRGQLQEGKPCPLCGSNEHPDMIEVDDVSEQLANLEQLRKQVSDELKALKKRFPKILTLEHELDQLKVELEKLCKAEETEAGAIRQHLKSYAWHGLVAPDKPAWKAFMDQISTAADKVKEFEIILADTRKGLANGRANIERYLHAANGIQNRIAGLDVMIETHRADLSVIKDRSGMDPNQDLGQLAQKILLEIREQEKQYDIVRSEIEMKKRGLVASRTTLEQQDVITKDTNSKLKKTEEEIGKKLSASPFSNLEEVTSILSLNMDIAQANNEIIKFDQSCAFIQKEIRALEETLRNSPFHEGTYHELKEKAASTRKEISELNEERIRLAVDLDREKNQLEEKKSIEAELQRVESRGADLAVLGRLFKSSGFVRYISGVFLKNLCLAANERFRHLTRKQFALELSDKDEFVIRDYLNEGKTRSVKTLSGGQTFQASLSLALALAESVQHQHQSVHQFFFLDEGFGALDKHALEVVFDTLKSLRKENRIVGIISHVEELQREIDVFLHVHRDPQKGSILRQSWQN